MYNIELGKDYRVKICDEEVIGFFIYDSCGEVDFPYLFIERATYNGKNGYSCMSDVIDDIVDFKSEIAKVISEFPKRKFIAVFEINQAANTCTFDLGVCIDDDDWCTAFNLTNCTDNEVFAIKRICDAFDIEVDWRR